MLFVCYPGCTTCQKARKWLEARGLPFEERNIRDEKPGPEELRDWYRRSGLPLKRFFNTSGLKYKELGLKDRLPGMSEEEQLALLATDGMLVKRPILAGDGFVLVGFREAEWAAALQGMCGRYQFTEADEAGWIAAAVAAKYGAGAWTPGDVLPGSRAPVLSGGSRPEPMLLSWGYPLRGKLVINARAETAPEKPLFREDLRARRCLIPATGFYEWDAEKRKHLFTLPGTGLFYLGGIFGEYGGAGRFCILTTAANATVSPVHPRMPLVFGPEAAGEWLSGEALPALLSAVPPALRSESREAQLSLW